MKALTSLLNPTFIISSLLFLGLFSLVSFAPRAEAATLLYENGFENGLGPLDLRRPGGVAAYNLAASLDQWHEGASSLRVWNNGLDQDGDGKHRLQVTPSYSQGKIKFKLNTHYWWGWSVYVPEDYPNQGPGAIIWQLNAGRGGPEDSLILRNNTWSWTIDNESRVFGLFKADVERGKWINWVIHKYRSYGSDGITEIWKDGVKVGNFTGNNIHNNQTPDEVTLSDYGIYWGVVDVNADFILYFDSLRIAEGTDGFNLVDPAKGANGTGSVGDGTGGSTGGSSTGGTASTPAAKFTIGDKVQVSETVVVRSAAAGTWVSAQTTGAQGTIIGGPVTKALPDGSSYTWWQINYNTGKDGWSAEPFLFKTGSGAVSTNSQAQSSGSTNTNNTPTSDTTPKTTTKTTPITTTAPVATVNSSSIIYQNNFDNSPLGQYTSTQAGKEFPNVDNFSFNKGSPISIVNGTEAFAGRSLRIELYGNVPNATPSASSLNLEFRLPGGGYDDLYTSFMYTTSPNFKTNASGKIAGLAGSDYHTHYNSGKCLVDGEFNSMPHLSGTGRGTHNYTFFYGMNNRCAGGTGFWWDGGSGSTNYQGPNINLAHGTWHHIEFRIKVNTPGRADGILQTWYDGELVLNNTSMEWRKTAAHNVERAKLQAFVSGGGKIKERGQFLYYDNYVVSTERMGPPPGVEKVSTGGSSTGGTASTPAAKFTIGDKVQVSETVVVRSAAAGTWVSAQVTGAQGTIIGGPVTKALPDGTSYTWWNINYNTGKDGWSAEPFLFKTGVAGSSGGTQTSSGSTGSTQTSTGSGNTGSDSIGGGTPVTNTSSSISLNLGGLSTDKSVTLNLNKPSNATKATVILSAHDADHADEGSFNVNNHSAIQLFADTGVTANNAVTKDVSFTVPVSDFVNGANTFTFYHTETGGYRVEGIRVVFDGNEATGGTTGGNTSSGSTGSTNTSSGSSNTSTNSQTQTTPTSVQSAKFNIGDKVQVSETVVVRSAAAGSWVSAQNTGAQGTIIGGPVTKALPDGSSYTWWQINYNTGKDGWSAEPFLFKKGSAPSSGNTSSGSSGSTGSTGTSAGGPPPSGGGNAKLIYENDFEGSFGNVRFANQCRNEQFQLTTNPVRSGQSALRVFQRGNQGCLENSNGGEVKHRSLVGVEVNGEQTWMKPNTRYWVGFSMYIPPNDSLATGNPSRPGAIIMHLMNYDSGAPGGSNFIIGGGQLTIQTYSKSGSLARRAVPTGWTDVIMEYVSSTGSDGRWNIWFNGTPVLNYSGSTTLFNKDFMFRVGLYWGVENITPDRTILFDNIKIAEGTDGYATVDPSR